MSSAATARALSPVEWRRKAVHAGMGLFALALRWLDWKAAAGCALAALLFNLLVMPRIGRGIYRDAARARDPGIVAYPAMVLVLILLFRQDLASAAALWAMMAFGDPAATVIGLRVGGPSLAWNPRKRWSGFAGYALVGGAAAVALALWVSLDRSPQPGSPVALAALLGPVAVLGALLESLDAGIDDNWLPPLPCALLLAFEQSGMRAPGAPPGFPFPWAASLALNAVVGYVTFRLRIVRRSGAVAGALAGALVLAFAGWPAYALLWTFFLLGTLATRLGYRRKQALGTAQAARGRRDARHVIANGAVPAALCLMAWAARSGWSSALTAAFAGALAAALADTLGTELGSLWGRRPISILAGGAVPPGTAGAVSWAGIAGGTAGACLIAAIAAAVGLVPWGRAWVVAAAGVVGSLAESLLADAARLRGRRVEHEFANAFNTFVGAAAALEIWASLDAGRLRMPFEWVRI